MAVVAGSNEYLGDPTRHVELSRILKAHRATGCSVRWFAAWPVDLARLETPIDASSIRLADLPALRANDSPLSVLTAMERKAAVSEIASQLIGLIGETLVRRVAHLYVTVAEPLAAVTGDVQPKNPGDQPPAQSGKPFRLLYLFDPGDGRAVFTSVHRDVDGAALATTLDRLDPRKNGWLPPSVTDIQEAGRELAKLLLPAEIATELATLDRHDYLEIVHDAAHSRIPWETLSDPSWRGVELVGMSRRYTSREGGRLASGTPPGRDEHLKILLIYNPTGDLPATDQEAAILSSLEARPGLPVKVVHKLTGPDATKDAILEALRQKGYDAVHYAGHAFFDSTDPARGGLLCHGRVVLTGEDIRGLPAKPRFVFLNACESMRIRLRAGDDEGKVRADHMGVGETFLLAGVAGMLGTFWPVRDVAGALFVQAFYGRLTQGQSVGHAVHAARVALRRQFRRLRQLHPLRRLRLAHQASVIAIGDRRAMNP